MPERDANQLAADVRATLDECERVLTAVWGFGHRLPVELANDVDDIDVEAATEKFEEIVALVGTLQQERDAERRWCKHWAERAEAAEAALAETEAARENWKGLAEYRGAALTNMTEWHNEATRALATTRQALELLLEWAEKDRGGGYPEENRSEEWYTHRDFARRALAAAGGDTKEPA